MEMLIQLLTRFGDKISSLGALVSAMMRHVFPGHRQPGRCGRVGFSQPMGRFVLLIPCYRCLPGLPWYSTDLAGSATGNGTVVRWVWSAPFYCCYRSIRFSNTAGAAMSPIQR